MHKMKSPPFSSSSSFSVLRKARLSPYLFTLLAFILFVAVLYGEDLMCIFSQQLEPPAAAFSDHLVVKPGESTHRVQLKIFRPQKQRFQWFNWLGLFCFVGLGKIKRQKLPFSIGKTDPECDIFTGRWVWDESNRPLYEESECPYIQPQLTCQEHGRPDKDYQKWRWQPDGCDLPRSVVKAFSRSQRLAKSKRV